MCDSSNLPKQQPALAEREGTSLSLVAGSFDVQPGDFVIRNAVNGYCLFEVGEGRELVQLPCYVFADLDTESDNDYVVHAGALAEALYFIAEKEGALRENRRGGIEIAFDPDGFEE